MNVLGVRLQQHIEFRKSKRREQSCKVNNFDILKCHVNLKYFDENLSGRKYLLQKKKEENTHAIRILFRNQFIHTTYNIA